MGNAGSLKISETSCETRFFDDGSLVTAAKAGVESAMAELLHRHSRMILRVTYRITRNQQDAEDAKQEALLNAYLHIHNFNGHAKFSTWITRIAVNSSLMLLRKRRRRVESIASEIGDRESSQTHQIIDRSVDIEASYLKQEHTLRLRNAICDLEPKLRTVMMIQQEQEGRSLRDTAEIANLTLSATKTRLVRAKRALRKRLV